MRNKIPSKRLIISIFPLIVIFSIIFVMIGVQSSPQTVTGPTQTTEFIVMRAYGPTGAKIQGDRLSPESGDIDIFQYKHTTYTGGSGLFGSLPDFYTPVTVVKLFDKASLPLIDIHVTGVVMPKVYILFYVSSVLVYNVTLVNADITQMVYESDASLTYEQLSLTYGIIYWIDEVANTWTGAKADGSQPPNPG